MFLTTQTEIVFSSLFEKDWLLIYRLDKNNNKLLLFRTGTHSDIFK